jgi:hypothetical protein
VRGGRSATIGLTLAAILVVLGTGIAALAGGAPGGFGAPVSASASAPGTGSRTAPGTARVQVAADAVGASDAARALQPVLDRRAAALLHALRPGWLALVSPGTPRLRADQARLFDRLRAVPISRWSYRIASASASSDQRQLTCVVRLSYRLVGDTRDVERDQRVTAVRSGTGWVLTAIAPVSTDGTPVEWDPWDLGPITVVRGTHSLVIGVGPPDVVGAVLRRTAREADDAARRVDAVWGTGWPRRGVVLMPGTVREMAMLLGRGVDTSGLDQVAAVTSGELSPSRRGVADRVVLNPGPFRSLSGLGRSVVLRHELTHIATRASDRLSPPLWVEEGFANYVAYRGTGLPATVVAADVVPLVRSGRAERRLPPPSAFDPRAGAIAPAYADAWIAFELIEKRQGPGGPARFYRAAAGLSGPSSSGPSSSVVSSSSPTAEHGASASDALMERAYGAVLHTTSPAFEADWLAFRRELLLGRRSVA